MSPDSRETTVGGEVSAAECRAICREAGAIWKETVGRGPNNAHAFASDVGISMIFQGVLTPVEHATVERGSAEQVRNIRRSLFESNRDRLIACVERESGRKVRAAVYDIDPAGDTSCFTFVFTASAGP